MSASGGFSRCQTTIASYGSSLLLARTVNQFVWPSTRLSTGDVFSPELADCNI